MSMYRDYARVYDDSGQLAFSLRMIPYLNLLLERHPVSGPAMLDLACGTGTIAIAMAEAGWRVYGVDGSAEMLAEAREKADENGVQVTWSQQDMRHVVLPEQVHLVTCLYDSMNYMLTDQDLLATFRSVFKLLQPGGLFLFDMNTAWVMASLWDDEIYFTDSDELSVIMQSEYDRNRQRTTVVVTCFERVDGYYRKIVEEHQEQAYPPEHIATLLTDVGFRAEAMYDCFSLRQPSPTSFRVMFVARKPA